jgi:hypothetical protein
MALEIGLVAEQPKAVLDFPLDAQRPAASELGAGSACAPRRERESGKTEDQDGKVTHDVCGDERVSYDKHAGCGGNVRPAAFSRFDPARFRQYNSRSVS